MGSVRSVVIQFPTVWWDDSLFKWLSANSGSNLSAVSGALDAQKAVGRLSSRRRELKQQLHRVGSEVALVKHANSERRRAAQQARSNAHKIAAMEPWRQTSLEIEDKDCLDTLALSKRPKPRFSVEFDAPHNRSAGWSVL